MKYVACYVDYGETFDGHPGIIGVYDTLKKAKQDVELDMNGYCENLRRAGLKDNEFTIDKNKLEIWRKIGEEGCVWSIHASSEK